MTTIKNIRSVSKYESKLLMRSWFFRIFTLLALFITTIFNIVMLVSGEDNTAWAVKAIPSNIPLMNLLILNSGQAVIAIFLASDFLKRDKKLDTSEVFYVRPLGNAAYVMGKIWGNLRVFLLINLLVMSLSLLFTLLSPDATIDWVAYPVCFLLVCVPTLVYIIGLSVFLMLILKNQAITFILLLGYVGLTLFYISDKFYYLFDYMAYFLPLMKSTITGYTNLGAILTHRAIYLFAGMAFIFLAIPLFRRLPSNARSSYFWTAMAGLMFVLCGVAAYLHVEGIFSERRLRSEYISTNNAYTHSPRMLVSHYDLRLTQQPRALSAEAKLEAVAQTAASVFTFCLNPGLRVEAVSEDGRPLSFERDKQILLVNFGREIAAGDSLTFTITYAGCTDNAFAYLDIPDKLLEAEHRRMLFSAGKQYGFQTPSYHLYTPENYWYPRPGTSFSSESAGWQQNYFSRFTLQVWAQPGLLPLSQGEALEQADGSYRFAPEYPVQALSLAIGRYRPLSITADSTRYTFWYIEGGDLFSRHLQGIRDTIPALIRNFREDFERTYKLSYPFPRFSVIETPASFYSYPHAWSQAEEVMQPEIVFFPERGWLKNAFGLLGAKEQERWMAKNSGQTISEEEMMVRVYNRLLSQLSTPEGQSNYASGERGEYVTETTANPYFAYPQLYNFRYNIFSASWPVAGRLVELYLQDNAANRSQWERDVNGLSHLEEANLLMEKQSFRELLADASLRRLSGPMAYLKASRLFAPAEVQLGIAAFRDSLYALLERNTFRNLPFDTLLDSLGQTAGCSLRSGLDEWERPMPLPAYVIDLPELSKYTHRGQEHYVMKVNLANPSGTDGYLRLTIEDEGRSDPKNDPRLHRTIALAARQGKQLVSVWDRAPRRITINTGVSANLPSEIQAGFPNIKQERGAVNDIEGDYPSASLFNEWEGEVIVDNEDPHLFELSQPAALGLLPQWLGSSGKTAFKYTGGGGRPPLDWRIVVNAGYYGSHIRSAHIVRNGRGTRTATWKVPVPSPGFYDVYYYMYNDNNRRNNRQNAEYHFRLLQDDAAEEAWLRTARATAGWETLGAYYLSSDTLRIVLSNETSSWSVAADAVRIVKK